MRRFTTYLAMVVIALVLAAEICVLWAQSLNDHPAYEVIVSNYGTRNGDTVTNAIAQVGNRACLFVFDRGPWQIQTNVTFPTNIGVVVGPDSYFVISNNCVMAFQTNDLMAWHYPVFTGSGSATGTAKMVFRMSQWGDATQYNIGLGDVETYVTNTYVALGDLATLMTNRYPNLQTNAAANTLAGVLSNGVNAASQNATNFALVQAVTGAFDIANIGTANIATQNVTGTFLNSSNDMAVSFMGFPKVVLTTNMVSSYASGGTLITIPSFTNAFDNSTATVTETGTYTTYSHVYQLNLGQKYTGYVVIKMYLREVGGGLPEVYIGSSYDSALAIDPRGNYVIGGNNSISTNIVISAFSGQYPKFTMTQTGTSSGTYYFYDFSIYAITNSYRNMGGF